MNIYDIAKLANVSIATVSRVVNDSPNVREKTKEKVRAVIAAQGYTPNAFARGLGLGSMKTVGIVCPSVSDLYMSQAIGILEGKLQEQGYQTLLSCSGYEQEEKEKRIEFMLHKKVDALVLIGSTYVDHGQVSERTRYIQEAAKQIPIFLINGCLAYENVYSAYCNDFQSVYDVTKKMLTNQFQQILFLYNTTSFSANQKRKGYEQAFYDCGIPLKPEYIIEIENSIEAVKEYLECNKELQFNGVIAVEDALAIGAIKYAKSSGKQIPEQLQIVGYNNSILAQCCEPELSSIDSAVEALCLITIQHIFQLLQKAPLEQGENTSQDIPPQYSSIQGEFIQRNTTQLE